MKVTVQNYKQLRKSFNLKNVNPDVLELFNFLDDDYDDYMELYVDNNTDNDSIREIVNNHIELVNNYLTKPDEPAHKKEAIKKEPILKNTGTFHAEMLDNHTLDWKPLSNIDFVKFASGNEAPHIKGIEQLDDAIEVLDEALDGNTFDYGGYKVVDQHGKKLTGRVLDIAVKKKVKQIADKKTPNIYNYKGLKVEIRKNDKEKFIVWDIVSNQIFANEYFKTKPEAVKFVDENKMVLVDIKKPATNPAPKKIEKVVDVKEVSFYTEEYRLIRRFYNLIKKGGVISFRSVNLIYMAFEKSALERKVRKSSNDAELFTELNKKVVKMFKASNADKGDIEINITDAKLLDKLQEYVGSQKVNYAITLIKSFIGLQGKKPVKDKVEKLLNRFESALKKERITKTNRLYEQFMKSKKALEDYIKAQNQVLEPTIVGLSVPMQEIKEKSEAEEIQELIDKNEFLEFNIKVKQEPVLIPVKNNYHRNLSNIEVASPEAYNDKSNNFETLDYLDITLPEEIPETPLKPQQEVVSQKQRVQTVEVSKEMAELGVKRMNDDTNHIENFFKLKGDLASFFGKIEIKPKESVAVTFDADQGGGKTRLMFQTQDMFADSGYKGLFASLEEHPDSVLFKKKRDEYIKPQNQDLIDTIGSLPNGFEDLKKLIPFYDYVCIDSFGKLQELNRALDFDRDLRKAFDGKVFFVIFQRTQDGKMRGGANSQFDGDIITKIKKEPDYRNSYAFFDKNRYQEKPLGDLKYNIFNKKLEIWNEAEALKDEDKFITLK